MSRLDLPPDSVVTVRRPGARLAHVVHHRVGVCRSLLAKFAQEPSPSAELATQLRDVIRRSLCLEARQLQKLRDIYEPNTLLHDMFIPVDVLDEPPRGMPLDRWLSQLGVVAQRVNRELSDKYRARWQAGDPSGLLVMVATGQFQDVWVQEVLLETQARAVGGKSPDEQKAADALLDKVVLALRRTGKGRQKTTGTRKRKGRYHPATQKTYQTTQTALRRLENKLEQGLDVDDAIAWVMGGIAEASIEASRLSDSTPSGAAASTRKKRALSKTGMAKVETKVRGAAKHQKGRREK